MDSDEFERLFHSTFRRVMAYCLRRTTETAAPDVVAEVYAVAWRRRRHIPSAEDDATLWLLGIARRVLANHTRSRRRWVLLVRRVAEQSGPVEPTDDDDAHEMAAALARLPPGDQEVLRLAYWDELSHREIATVLRISQGAVAVRLHRARERLRRSLSAAEDQEVKERHDAQR
ncbi:RNA polymerase sigma factor [Actinomadura sp. HBU206391]|uniref:RNA polymerase sigma factor n=1 Tax=Actinomadura sp. HBU206391 TaxID=2731692 RepID=UPI00164EEF6D|nr:sigma-70 family RNA polymerase sigma factor [Actinomadura sp. HBU206391]MBC6458262.1 sigma-70 family RNA polymerase sigma factor [Actinomadura sp. HBU206391]